MLGLSSTIKSIVITFFIADEIHESDFYYTWILFAPSAFMAVIFLCLNWWISTYLEQGGWRGPLCGAQLDPYECGFEPYGIANHRFLIFFYVIGILYIIFDLELIYVVPWFIDAGVCAPRAITHSVGFGFFVGILIAGFIYEWKWGVLDIVYTATEQDLY